MFQNVPFPHKAAWLAAIGLALCLGLPATPGHAGSCIKDAREFKIADGTILKLRDYLCEGQDARFRVQFHRLNDRTFAGLLEDKLPGILKGVLGQGRVIRNDISAEWQTLVSRFGEDEPIHNQNRTLSLSVEAAGDRGESTQLPQEEYRPFKVLIPNEDENPVAEFPPDASIIPALTRSQTPADFKKVAGAYGTVYWRYVTYRDIENYGSALSAWNRQVARLTGVNRSNFQKAKKNKYISLLQYLGKAGWPSNFAAVNTSYDQCASKWEFAVYKHTPLIDVAVIENVGSAPIRIDAALASRSRTLALRPQRDSRALRSAPREEISLGNDELRPGERLIVPTRIAFAVPDKLRQLYGEAAGRPEMESYVYGPELLVAGVRIGDERVILDEQSANFLSLTTSCDCGSCPYLYAWDQAAKSWRKHGKVIHTANGPDAQQTETVTFDGLFDRFRLIEQEAELAYIDQVTLRLELVDGSSLAIPTRRTAIATIDSRYAHIFFGETLSIDFDLPKWVDRSQVVKSHISVTGFYHRYSEIMPVALNKLQSGAN